MIIGKSGDFENFDDYLRTLDSVEEQAKDLTFDREEHDHKSRLYITRLFLFWYFGLIAGGFVFCFLYNIIAAWTNFYMVSHKGDFTSFTLPYLEVTNTVSIITTTLSSGLGFVIGYYFKNKGEH